MKITKENLNLENGLEKEWLITNGIGGFASSTIIGANTRRYHGLLIAPLAPPARRHLILSKVDESLEINGEECKLYTNICENYISQGYKNLDSFEYEYIPTFNYKINDINIQKNIVMEYGKNTVGIQYKIKNGKEKAKFNLAPILNFRDFHSMSSDENIEIRQQINNTKIKVVLDNRAQFPIYIKFSEGKYVEHTNDVFRDMLYIEEEKRGFYPKENHIVSGVCQVELRPYEKKEITVVCSFEENIDEINVGTLIKKEEKRLKTIIDNTQLVKSKKDELIQELIIASDKFIVYRPSFSLHTILAGYPWFLDWGRDTLISFEGLLLKTKRFEIAKEVLLTMVRDIKFGLVPNGYSGFDNRPLYNSVDSSLLLFEQVKKYIEYTGDYEFIKENIYEKLKKVIENYKNGIDLENNNIYLDKDYLIVSGTEDTQNTWMDVKYNDFAVTPRNGKAVEINSLWYNSLMIMAELTTKFETVITARKYKQMAKKCKETFNDKFYNPQKKCLYDVLGDDKIRPNQLFSLSVTYPVIEPDSETAYNIINTVEKKLLNSYGLKTLAKGEEHYVEVYEGNVFKRDTSYHQGITWTWLLGLYYNALMNMLKAEKDLEKKKEIETKIKKFKEKTKKTFKKELYENGCIGNIAEIYDSAKPQLPKGTIAQAWSLGEVLRILS